MSTAQIDDVVVQAVVAIGALICRGLAARACGDEETYRDLAATARDGEIPGLRGAYEVAETTMP